MNYNIKHVKNISIEQFFFFVNLYNSNVYMRVLISVI